MVKNENLKKFKPDFEQASERLEAYWNKTLIDRPAMRCAVRKENTGVDFSPVTYKDRVYGDLDKILHHELEKAAATSWLGESVPGFLCSLGTHEIASYCGFEIEWSEKDDTNWCTKTDRELSEVFPIQVDKKGFWYQRTLEIYRKTKEIFKGSIIPYSFDFHTNMDLLLSIRGEENLCFDMYDCPEDVEKGVEYAMQVFKDLWETFVEKSGCEEYGYFFNKYSEKPTTLLACDFEALIGEEDMKKFALPALTYESEIVGDRTMYHWDGPDALRHKEALCSIPNLHTFAFIPNPGVSHLNYLDVYKYCQSKGKSISFGGSPEEIKIAHKELNPELTFYNVWASSEKEFDDLEKWMIRNT